MERKWFLLVGEDGKALTAADAVSVDIEDVVALRDAVKKKFEDSLLAGIAASDLTVLANRSAFDAEQKPLKSSSAVHEFGKDVSNALIVQVPTQRRVSPIMDILPQVHWTVAPEPCPQLSVQDGDRLIELPPFCVDGTGIGSPGQPLILYRRPALVKQWGEMNRCSIRTYARLWVVGPPGTGKSCAALSFAWSLNRLHWDVIWLHHARELGIFHCVWLQRDKKAVCVVKEETVERDLATILNSTSQTRKTIVFLDGYISSSPAGEAARLKCLYWQQEDEIKHRLVFVCSITFFAGRIRVRSCLGRANQIPR